MIHNQPTTKYNNITTVWTREFYDAFVKTKGKPNGRSATGFSSALTNKILTHGYGFFDGRTRPMTKSEQRGAIKRLEANFTRTLINDNTMCALRAFNLLLINGKATKDVCLDALNYAKQRRHNRLKRVVNEQLESLPKEKPKFHPIFTKEWTTEGLSL